MLTYENRRFSPKAKSSKEEKEVDVVIEESTDEAYPYLDPLALLTRNFHKYLKSSKKFSRSSSEVLLRMSTIVIQGVKSIRKESIRSIMVLRVMNA